MKSAAAIESEFREKGVARGGLLLLNYDDAASMIRRCREENVRILGIDGFLVTQSSTQPLMEHSVDFSGGGRAKSNEERWLLAEEFVLQEKHRGLMFELVIED